MRNPDQSAPTVHPNRGEPVRIRNVVEGVILHVLSLSADYGGLFTHFVRGRSRYCDPAGCRPEYHKTERYFRGYFAALVWSETRKLWEPSVWELTESSELDVHGRFSRGQVWMFSRAMPKAGKHAAVTAMLYARYEPTTLPPAFDIKTTLRHLYHCEKLDLSAVNPMPPRLMVPPVAAFEGLQLLDSPADTNEKEKAPAGRRPSIIALALARKGKETADGHETNGKGHNGQK